MKNIQLYDVAPSIPKEIRFLETLGRNLWWCWSPDAIDLFRRISPELWRESGLNPLQFLLMVPQERMEGLAVDDGFLTQMKHVQAGFEEACATAGREPAGDANICYFSLEYGIHESVRLYSGGLGVLAGDHLKAASDMNLPLVAVGLLYHQGYFRQYLDSQDMQQEAYPKSQIRLLPLVEHNAADGAPLMVHVPLPEGTLHAVVWSLQVGRVTLYLLDTRIAENPPEFREITAQLYGGDKLMRLRQELLLGIGGHRALVALGYDPAVCHINEGHAAFMSLGRMAHLVQTRGMTLEAAREVAARTNVFTTHTPVPAGNETFSEDLLKPHLKALEPELGIGVADVLRWTRPSTADGRTFEPSMTVLGLRMAQFCNGVSALHGDVARKMWGDLWPEFPEDEVPIGHVTNGVHVPSWLSPDMSQLLDHYVGPHWRKHPAKVDQLQHIDQIPDDELWHTHEVGRSRLISLARSRLQAQLAARNATQRELREAESVLDNGVLTIGFARRFATYKRATLLLSDIPRLEAILGNKERPVQLVFAGKAHPADQDGKAFIQQIVEFSRKPGNRTRVIFLENYDIHVGRRLVQGVDVWLNTPRRPQEASGTSGMKAAVNGALNASVLDGWWCEGYTPECGWAIGTGEVYEDESYQDMVEAQALYNLLEDDLIPRFYDRPGGGTPLQWTRMMKASMRMALGFFTSHRMLAEYSNEFYMPAMENYRALLADDGKAAVALAADRQRLKSTWPNVSVGFPQVDKDITMLHVGDTFTVTVDVHLGKLSPEEVAVEVYHGQVNADNVIGKSALDAMAPTEDKGHGLHLYQHTVSCRASGRYGFTVRVVPKGKNWRGAMPGFMAWASA